jgi:hypothetical protein
MTDSFWCQEEEEEEEVRPFSRLFTRNDDNNNDSSSSLKTRERVLFCVSLATKSDEGRKRF